MSKYHSVRYTVDGIVFDSKREARRYFELLALERAGIIKDLQRQVKFVLIPAQYEGGGLYLRGPKKGLQKPGKLLEREVSYTADFVYVDNQTGEIVVEDTKGFKTKDYVIKRKLLLYVYGIRIKET